MEIVKIIDGDRKSEFNLDIPVFYDDKISTIKNKIFTKSEYLYPGFISIYDDNGVLLEDSSKYLYEYGLPKFITFKNILSISHENPFEYYKGKFVDLKESELEMLKLNQLLGRNSEEYLTFLEENKKQSIKNKESFKQDLQLLGTFQEGNVIDKVENIKSTSYFIQFEKNITEKQMIDIFKKIQLTRDIPIVIYKPNIRKNAEVKVYDDIKNTFPQSDIEDAIFTESGTKKVKGGKGLTFKINSFGGLRTTATLLKNKINLRCEMENGDPEKCFEVSKILLDQLEKVVKFNVIGSDINSVITDVFINKVFDESDFMLRNYKLFFKFSAMKEADTDTISLKYTRTNKDLVNLSLRPFQDRTKLTVSAQSKEQLKIILSRINQVILNIDGDEVKTKAVGKANVKKLREKGKTDSIGCQKKRQPVISSTDQPATGSYDLINNGNRYICKNPDYIYPGFTNKNVPCCFVVDQRQKKSYKKNQEGVVIEIYPSNIPVSIGDKTYLALKNDNDKFFYLDDFLNLVEISDSNIVEKLLQETDWKNKVNIQVLKTVSKKCKSQPEDLATRRCQDGQSFGYSNKGEPCCFKKLPVSKQKEKVLKKDIIKTAKILDPDRFGVLPDILKDIIGQDFYRIGVKQDKKSFMHAVNKASGSKMSSITRSVFDRSLASDSFSYESFKDYLNSKNLDHKLLSEMLSDTLDVNIIVLNGEDSVSCYINRIDTPFDESKKYIVILKSEEYYEPIGKLNMKMTFDKADLKQLLDLYKFSCQAIAKENTPLTLRQTIKKLGNTSQITQIVNKNGNINYIEYLGKFIPVYKSKPVKDIRLDSVMEKTSARQQIAFLNSLGIEQLIVDSQLLDENMKTTAVQTKSGLIIPVKRGDMIEGLDISNLNYYSGLEEIVEKNNQVDDKRVKAVVQRLMFEEYKNRVFYITSEFIRQNELKKNIVSIKDSKDSRQQKISQLKEILDLEKIISSKKVNSFDSFIKNRQSKRTNCPVSEKCELSDYCVLEDKKCKLVLLHDFSDITLGVYQEILKNDKIIHNFPREAVDKDNFIRRDSEVVLMDPEQIMRWLN